MHRSTDRILTTHVGSLPRPPELVAALTHADHGNVSASDFDEFVRAAIVDAVEKQAAAGIDVVSDGEMGKIGFFSYVAERLSNYHLETSPDRIGRMLPPDIAEFPEMLDVAWAGVRQAIEEGTYREEAVVFINEGPTEYAGSAQLASQLEMFTQALEGHKVTEAFVPATSPLAVVGMTTRSSYSDPAEMLDDVTTALAQEYRAIIDAGFLLQIDDPGLTGGTTRMSRNERRASVASRVDVYNTALTGIDPERVRVHMCWGNWPGPHHLDAPIADVFDLVCQINANGISVEAANPRHEHEWRIFEDLRLPDGKVIIPGVIDSCSNYIEHPEVVAERILRYANLVGRENVIASTDCGFASSSARTNVLPRIVYAKLASLAEGSRLASERLWP